MRSVALALLAVVAGSSVMAQDGNGGVSFGVAPHVGTLGFGAELGVGLHPRFTIRAGGNYLPFTPSITSSDIDFDITPARAQFTGLADVFLVGGFRLSGGIRVKSAEIEALAVYTGSVTIGDSTYTGDDVGELTGSITTNDLSPYLGIGFGNVGRRGLGFFLDAGVAFHGKPGVTLAASGPIAGEPAFEAELEKERQEFEDEIDWVRFYPVLSVGVSLGF